MTETNHTDAEIALDHIHDSTKARFFLRRFLGRDTRYEEINGHLFKPNIDDDAEWSDQVCQSMKCELSEREWADEFDCPTPAEALDMRRPRDF